MRGLRYSVEGAGDERAASVGLDDLDLEALAGAERVGAERRHADHPATDQHQDLALSLDSRRTPTGGYRSSWRRGRALRTLASWHWAPAVIEAGGEHNPPREPSPAPSCRPRRAPAQRTIRRAIPSARTTSPRPAHRRAVTVTSRADQTRTVGAPAHHEDVPDDQSADVPTVLDRFFAAGLSEERIERHMAAGVLRIDGELVTDLNAAAPIGSRIVVWAH